MGQEEYSRPLLKNLETTGVPVELYLGTAVGSYHYFLGLYKIIFMRTAYRPIGKEPIVHRYVTRRPDRTALRTRVTVPEGLVITR